MRQPRRMRVHLTALILSVVVWPGVAADFPQQRFLDLVAAGRTCEPVPNNGFWCTYKVGGKLTITIKDVGGSDTSVGFRYSNVAEKYYAVWYFDCVAVVPGNAHPPGYAKSYNAFISPKTGNIYSTSSECRSAK
jgi:hypothetical protein